MMKRLLNIGGSLVNGSELFKSNGYLLKISIIQILNILQSKPNILGEDVIIIYRGEYSAPVVYSRDSTPISAESGKMILQTFKEQPPKPNILDSFEYMDRREDYIRAQRDHNEEFEKFFDECCEYYKSDPDGYQPQKKSYYNKKSSKKGSNYSYNNSNKKFNNGNNNTNANNNENTTKNNNYYRNKGSNYYKKSGAPANTNANANNNSNKAQPAATKAPVNLEEQFVIKTEIKLVKKTQEHRYRGKGKNGGAYEGDFPCVGGEEGNKNH